MATFVVRSPIQHFPDTSPARMKALFPSETFVDASGNAVTTPFAIYDPDLTAVRGQPVKYWKLNGDLVELMTRAEQDAVDAAEDTARKDLAADEMDIIARSEISLRALVEIMIDEFNRHALKHNEILDAIDAGANASEIKANIAAVTDYPQRTRSQFKTQYRTKLDGT